MNDKKHIQNPSEHCGNEYGQQNCFSYTSIFAFLAHARLFANSKAGLDLFMVNKKK
jgi:hypothetical protein